MFHQVKICLEIRLNLRKIRRDFFRKNGSERCCENEGRIDRKWRFKNHKILLISEHQNSGQFSQRNWAFWSILVRKTGQNRKSKFKFGQFWSEKLAIWSVLKIKLATKKPSIYAGLRAFWSVSQFFSLINVI